MIPSGWVGRCVASLLCFARSRHPRLAPTSPPWPRRTAVPAGFPRLSGHVSLFLSGKSFREQQCEKYNGYNFTDLEGNRLEWVPKYAGVSPRDRCKLFCRARGRSEFKVFEAKVRHPVMIIPLLHPVSHRVP